MKCPNCNGKTTVTDTVHRDDTNETYRKKKCLNCGHTFYTVEFDIDDPAAVQDIWQKYRYRTCRQYIKTTERKT